MIKIGDEITGKIVSLLNNNQWKVEIKNKNFNNNAILISRSAKLYKQYDEEKFWIFEMNNEEILLSDTNFGRLPISDRMRPRYLNSLQHVINYLNNPSSTRIISSLHFSEVKGMFNRCVRKDQWDWFTIYLAFGMPPIELIRKAAVSLGNLAKAYKNFDTSEILLYTNSLLELRIIDIITKGFLQIEEDTPKLISAKSFTNLSKTIFNGNIIANDKNVDPYIISQFSRAKLEKANKSHEETLTILVKTLQDNGFIVEYSGLIDAYCRLKTGPAIFEVKSISLKNERLQFRRALSQLYEYRYLHSVPNSTLWLVLSNPPSLFWIVDYLEKDRDVNVLWIENGTLQGRSIDKLYNSW